MDKLKSLIIFLRSAQHQSFSEAARQLSMSPSAVSLAVARLEEDLGIRLLQRTTRSLTLTEDGTKYFDRCQQILDELEAAELEIKQSRSIPTGTLRLNLSIAIGKMYIAPRLPEFALQYPDLKLNVSFSDRISDMIEEGIDATVRVGVSTDSSLRMQAVAKAYVITCAAPSYLQQAGIPSQPEEIAKHRCMNFVLLQTRRDPSIIFIHDTYFYWMHRFIHWKPIFKYVHHVHHLSINPTPWAAYSFHPIEALLEVAIFSLLIFTVPLHPVAMLLLGNYQLFMNIVGHCGYEFMPSGFTQHKLFKWLNTSTHHNIHHAKFNCNYGLYFTANCNQTRHREKVTASIRALFYDLPVADLFSNCCNIWDRLMGTNHPSYDAIFEQVKAKSLKS